ncbi:uncharacterized protein LOC122242781 [Penaeus japonicus]|uniref:uncharacterized protein LOC122242781 n=1 Tax=Penaeus japonicus TaxID=27405 RepID=UPI001C713F26|nr:uncharacterized protein LOC122242781 [Penaeus japonicus]
MSSTRENDQLTAGVVKAALAADKGPGVRLSSWSSESMASQMDGNTSDVQRLQVTYLNAEGREDNVSYVAKIMRSKDDFYNMIHAKECNFYSEIVPALNAVLREAGQGELSVPKCFFQCTEKGREIIVLENLKDQGYEQRDKTEGIDAAHTVLVLEELAKLHAASLLLQEKTPQEDLRDRFICLQKEWTKEFNVGCTFEQFVGSYLERSIVMFEKIGGQSTVVEWIKKIKPEVIQMFTEQIKQTSPFAVICHADPWINNFLYKYDESKNPIAVKLFDFQGCRKSSIANDLQHLFNMNLAGPVRRPNMDYFLRTYYSSFARVLEAGGSKPLFTLEELAKEYRDKGFYGLLLSLLWIPNMVRRPEDYVDIIERSEEAVDNETRNVLRMVDSNPLLKPRILSIVEEWTEWGVIS